MNTMVSSPIIVALDYPHPDLAIAMAQQLDPQKVRLKIGKEMFTLAGPALVEKLHQMGFEVFLDLKFHDIPNTVAGALRSAASLGIWMVNVHASGGRKMLDAAVEAVKSAEHQPLLTAVTVLTSMDQDQLSEIGVSATPEQQVQRLALLSQDTGVDGVVCSAQEAPLLNDLCGDDFLLVTPGIRPKNSATDDQKRVMTPQQALQNGVDYMVIGRPITQAENPQTAVSNILREITS